VLRTYLEDTDFHASRVAQAAWRIAFKNKPEVILKGVGN
jgi:hypothetical protein